MKVSMKHFIFTLLISLTIFTGCNKKTTAKPISDKKGEVAARQKTIGFSIDTLAIERWQRDLDVFINKAKELDANVIVQNAGNSMEEQNRQLMYLADRNVDVIVVLPKQADAFSDTIQKIRAKNIPVISYDRLLLNTDIDLYVTINSEKVGELMAHELMKRSRGNNWFCILGDEEDYNMTLIIRGIDKVIRGSPYKINHTFYTEGWNYDLAYNEMVSLLSSKLIPDAIVCGNDAVADSVIQALNLYYNERHIPVCGQDADIAACQYIVQGKQDFTVYKPITLLAEKCAEYAVRLANGEDSATLVSSGDTIDNGYGKIPVMWLEPQVVTKENLDEVVINSGFHTQGEIYR